MYKLFLSFSLCALLAAAELKTPIDPAQYKQATQRLIDLARDADNAAVITQARRVLEMIPNDPELQAPIYQLMSAATAGIGDTARAKDYAAIAKHLNPLIDSNTKPAAQAVTRGDPTMAIQTAANVVGQAMNAYQQIRLMQMCLEMVKHNMTPPAACSAQNSSAPAMTPIAGSPVVPSTLPPAPVGIAPAPVAAPASMPAPAPDPSVIAGAQTIAPIAPIAAAPAAPVAPAAPPMPTGVQTGAAVVFPAAPVGSPNAIPAPAAPAPMPGWQAAPSAAMQAPPAQSYPQQSMYQTQQTGSPTQAGQYAYARPSARTPYANAGYRMPPRRTRGSDDPVFKVIHDHSTIGSATYFETSCGALLTVSGADLTFTPSGGEASLVIPASEILEIRLNSTVGREAGVFHISTRQGLYLALAPESLDREQAREFIETLRAKLGIVE